MPTYTYFCEVDGHFTVRQPMSQAKDKYPCAVCGVLCPRDWREDLLITDMIPRCQGFERTDYDKYGDKLERLNRSWERKTGMKAPPMDKSVPRNSKDIT